MCSQGRVHLKKLALEFSELEEFLSDSQIRKGWLGGGRRPSRETRELMFQLGFCHRYRRRSRQILESATIDRLGRIRGGIGQSRALRGILSRGAG
jgi:hypothetical protein